MMFPLPTLQKNSGFVPRQGKGPLTINRGRLPVGREVQKPKGDKEIDYSRPVPNFHPPDCLCPTQKATLFSSGSDLKGCNEKKNNTLNTGYCETDYFPQRTSPYNYSESHRDVCLPVVNTQGNVSANGTTTLL